MSIWAYKISTKGTYIYLCRYNCHRAAEKRLEKKTRRVKELKKPSKEQLEIHLRAGELVADIARRYETSVQNIYNWIKSYGLEGVKERENLKPKAPTPAVETPPIGRSAPTMTSGVAVVHGEVIAQPTPAEVEQFHTDVPVQELPVVGLDGVELTEEGHELVRSMVEEALVKSGIKPTWSQDEWESSTKEKWEGEPVIPALPRGPFAEVWQGVLEDIQSIRRVQIKMAEDEFKAQFLKFARAVLGEEAI